MPTHYTDFVTFEKVVHGTFQKTRKSLDSIFGLFLIEQLIFNTFHLCEFLQDLRLFAGQF